VSFGRTVRCYTLGTENDVGEFEREGFIRGVDRDCVKFHYRPLFPNLHVTSESSQSVAPSLSLSSPSVQISSVVCANPTDGTSATPTTKDKQAIAKSFHRIIFCSDSA
jgi:hypothetical protein